MFAQNGIEVNFTSASVSVLRAREDPRHSPSNAHAYRLLIVKEHAQVGHRRPVVGKEMELSPLFRDRVKPVRRAAQHSQWWVEPQ
jgi:hypothetical protein